jgi:sugar phosphate isomerase/epimerase
MRLGVDSFSLRFQGWDAFRFLDYAARLGLDVVQFSTREDLASHDAGYLQEVRSHAGRLGLQIEVGMGSIDRYASTFRPELGSGAAQLIDMCRAAAQVGSPVVRCFLGMQSDRRGAVPIQEHIAECVRTLREAAPVARELGLKLAVENHGFGDLLADELRALVEAAGPDVAAVTLDTGNPVFAAEDPVYSAEMLAPYVATTHFRDSAIWEHERGAEAQWTILGRGTVDLRGVLDVWEARCPGVAVNLETITGGPPRVIPYFDPRSDFWQMYPDMPARSLARFIPLAREGTRAGARPLDQLTAQPGPHVAPEVAERLREQQRAHFEQSAAYAREHLGLGERARRRAA